MSCFLDPFEEFLKEKGEKDKAEERKAEIQRQGGTEDDRKTWTGKRIREDGSVSKPGATVGVGKYLKSALAEAANEAELESNSALVDTWEEPLRKKVKTGGFGNFDGW